MTGNELEPAVHVGEIAAGPPTGWTEIGLRMSNFDYEIDDGFDEALRAGGVYGRHAAWDFNGLVWFAAGRFHEQVWRYGSPVETLSADTLRDLMDRVNSAYGAD